MRTLWLRNSKGEIWDLMAKQIRLDFNCFAYDFNSFVGYGDDVTLTQVGSNFAVDGRSPQGGTMSCTMLFANHRHIRMFNEFTSDPNGLQLCYDPQGLILPNTQLMQVWYKRCAFVSVDIATKGTHRLFECSVSFHFLTAKWQRDNILSSTLMGIQDDATILPFYYPFYFYSSGKIGLRINNENDETSCRVEVTNRTGDVLNRCAWVAYYADGTRQYAEWMAGANKLRDSKRLIVDSEQGNEQAYITSVDEKGNEIGTKEIVTREQAIGTRFENFITIKMGKNEILFDFGRTDNIEVIVTYKEQVKMGLV